jgi:hypothetical protein
MGEIALRSALTLGLLLFASSTLAQKFYPDDPLWKEPPPRPALDPEPRALSEILEGVSNLAGSPGERQPARGVIEALGVNTLGEVMDGPWYVNRHGHVRMTLEELKGGAGDSNPPSVDGEWKVLIVKPSGLRPAFSSRRERISISSASIAGPSEMATAREMIASKFFSRRYYVPGDTS